MTRRDTRPLRWSRVLPAALVCMTVAVIGGCGAKERKASQEPTTSWNSPRLLAIQKEWDATARITTQDKSRYQELQNHLHRILASNLSDDDLHNLAATCGTLPARAKDRSEFANAVLAYMEETLIDAGDRESLVRLLSTRCQLRIMGYADIEFYLVIRGEKLKDPLLVLGEAFSKCKVPEVRHDLAGAVRRGFIGLGIRGKDDTEYVKNAMQWYEKEKGHLTVNPRYAFNTELFPADTYDEMPELYERNEKAAAAGRMELLFKRQAPEK